MDGPGRGGAGGEGHGLRLRRSPRSTAWRTCSPRAASRSPCCRTAALHGHVPPGRRHQRRVLLRGRPSPRVACPRSCARLLPPSSRSAGRARAPTATSPCSAGCARSQNGTLKGAAIASGAALRRGWSRQRAHEPLLPPLRVRPHNRPHRAAGARHRARPRATSRTGSITGATTSLPPSRKVVRPDGEGLQDAAAREEHEQRARQSRSPTSARPALAATSIRGYAEGLLDGIATTPSASGATPHASWSRREQMSELVSQLSLFSKLDLVTSRTRSAAATLRTSRASWWRRAGTTTPSAASACDLARASPPRHGRRVASGARRGQRAENAVRYAPGWPGHALAASSGADGVAAHARGRWPRRATGRAAAPVRTLLSRRPSAQRPEGRKRAGPAIV